MQSVNGPQFEKMTPLFLSSNRFAASSAHTVVIVMIPLTSMYASLQSHKGFVKVEFLN